MKGEYTQNMGKILPQNEAKMTTTQFSDWLKDCVKYASHNFDKTDFALGSATIRGDNGPEEWPIILDSHFLKRLHQRTYMSPDDIMLTIKWVLSLPTIGRTVINNAVCWDDNTNQVVPANEANVMSTAVQLVQKRMTLVFEAGFSYIRVKTIWAEGITASHKNQAVITVRKSGLIVFD